MCKVQSTKELRRAEAEGLTSLAAQKSHVGAHRRVSQRAVESERTRTQNTPEGTETKPHRKRSRTYPVSHVRDASVVRGHASSSTRRAVGAAALAPAAASACEVGMRG